MTDHRPDAFSRALLEGLGELGPVDPFGGDLTLELGLSVWLRRSGTSLLEARDDLLGLRSTILDVGGFDATCEPVPLVGRTPRTDVLTLAAYLAALLRRVAAATGRSLPVLVDQVLAASPAPRARALGA